LWEVDSPSLGAFSLELLELLLEPISAELFSGHDYSVLVILIVVSPPAPDFGQGVFFIQADSGFIRSAYLKRHDTGVQLNG
jgi:hypothetical protein